MGSANQAVTPGRTSLLEAVNICLAVIGEAPVNTLEGQQVGEAAQAERTLLEYHKEGQVRGWSWNRERAVAFYPDADSGELLIPASVAKWAPSRIEWNNRFQARGSRVYDSQERSYAIPASIASIEADIVVLLPWDDCPEVFNRWATIRAARVFSNRAIGNTTTYQLTQADEDQAWADLLRVDTEQGQPNAITGEEAWATFRPAMGLGRRHGSSSGWGGGGGVQGGGNRGVGALTLPQPLGQDASPTFAGLTLAGMAPSVGSLVLVGAGGQLTTVLLGSNLSITDGTLNAAGGGAGGGGYPSLSVPTGFSVSGSGTASMAITFAAGYSLPLTATQANWDTAFSERLRWDGGSTGLNAATGRTNLGLGTAATFSSGDFAAASHSQTASTISDSTTTGRAVLTAADAAAARTAIGAGTSSLALSNAAPAALAATAAAGSSADAARIDHAHARSTYADLGAIADGIVFTISNRGETATQSTNYDESLPLSFAVTITKITFITHIDNTGSSTTTLSAYKRTAAGTKTALLSVNATLASGASVATGSLSGTAGVLSLAAGDRLGVDLIGLGTGASGIKCIIEYTRSAV